MAKPIKKQSELDAQIDDALEGFLDKMGARSRGILSLLIIGLGFYFLIWPARGAWGPFVIPLILVIGQIFIAILFGIVQFVAIFWFLSRTRTYWLMPGETGIGFKDYKGNPEIIDAAREIVILLRGVKEFKQMGGEHIRGLLLVGPPGTGKSYLAQAISTEANLPFGYLSAPSLTSMFMGVGTMKVMFLYRKARKMARKYGACILFIDEIDAVGGSRGGRSGLGMMGGLSAGGFMGAGAGILNELLMQMDPPPADQTRKAKILRWLGVRRKKADMPPVLTIAATNLVQVLDPALLRPGRFDRKIRIEAPSAAGRREVIEYYLAKVHHDPNIDIERMVNDTPDYTPVAIKYVINEAVVHAHFAGRDAITYEDFTRARDTHEYGIRQPVKSLSLVDKRRIAYHEAGHTIAQLEYAPITRERFTKVTLMRYGNFGANVGGFSATRPMEERGVSGAEELLASIKISLASRAAEEIFLGTRLNGVFGDFQNATREVAEYLFLCGMGDTLVNPFAFNIDQMGLGGKMLERVEAVLQQCYADVKALVERRRVEAEAIAEALFQRDELNAQDVDEILTELRRSGMVTGPTPAEANSTIIEGEYVITDIAEQLKLVSLPPHMHIQLVKRAFPGMWSGEPPIIEGNKFEGVEPPQEDPMQPTNMMTGEEDGEEGSSPQS
jgi:cell division protease FtsH